MVTAAVPAPLRLALEDLGVGVHALVEDAPDGGPPRRVRRCLAGGLVVDLAVSDEGRRLNLLELRGRDWAEMHAIPTVPVLRADREYGEWIVARKVPLRPSAGPDYVRAALDASRRICVVGPPPPGPVASTWRAPRRTLAVRVARAVAAGVPVATVRRARSRAAALPLSSTAHGDYHLRNVLAMEDGGVAVVDWEHLAPAPAYTDALRLWTTLKAADDRQLLIDHLTDRLRADEREPVAVLAVWLAYRLWAENVCSPRAHQRPDDARHARHMVTEAEALRKDLLRRGP